MDDDDDFLPSAQIRRRMSQYSDARPSTSRPASASQGRPSARSVHGSQAGPSSSQTVVSAEARPSTSQGTELSQSEMATLKTLAQKLTDRRLNLDLLKPATADKKPVIKEKIKCVFYPCPSSLANVSSLLRHYKNVHSVADPAKFHGCTVDNNVVNLDDSVAEHTCVYCGHVARDANALDVHSATSHGTVQNKNLNNPITNVSTSVVAGPCKDMLKCDECSGYFPDKSKLDDHQRLHHVYQALCKICNKNFLFKDFDDHIRSSHPEIHDKKKQVIVKKVQRTKSGKTRFVFHCTECTESFLDEGKAKKHSKAHSKGLKTRVVRNNRYVENTDSDPVDSPPESNILFQCDTCNIATESCDTVVQHSQNHITNPNNKFKTVTCDVCDLAFEPACYDKHEVRHYKDNQIGKESFTIYKYKYHLLLTDNWTVAFDMPAEEVEKLFSQSIFAHTRSVKMHVLSVNGMGSKVINMYKCGQCNTFVEPASVVNHTSNYNTCVKITKKFACSICAREFVSRLARDNHKIVHNGGEAIRIVAFNATRDRELNNVLNDPNIISNILINHVTQDAENNTNANNDAVIYKCTCGLRFVSKEKSESHFKVCLKNDPIQNCPKCDSLFNLSELEDHLKQHTIGGSKFVYRDISVISIEPIVIDSDDESENDRATRDNSRENNNQMVVKGETSQTVTNSNSSSVPEIIILDSDDEMDSQSNNVEVSTDEQTNNDDAPPLPSTATENEEVCMSESDYQTELEENHHGGDLNNDDSSQDTITYEESLNANTDDVFNTNEIKCVPTNLLLRPSYGSVSQTSDEVRDEIESMRRHIEMVAPVAVKQERPWISDPTNFSHISRRPSLRHDLPVSCTVDLLTDDEDEMGLGIVPASAQTENIDVNEDANNTDTLQTLSRETSTASNENICDSNNKNAVAIALPDVLINIDNIIRGFNESTTKCKLLNASGLDVENSNSVEVKRENDLDHTDERQSEHRLDWPTSARSSSQESSMVLFQNVQNSDTRNWQRNYNLNILVADQNGSIKESNKNCTIC